jgi:hypothetical protein
MLHAAPGASDRYGPAPDYPNWSQSAVALNAPLRAECGTSLHARAHRLSDKKCRSFLENFFFHELENNLLTKLIYYMK